MKLSQIQAEIQAGKTTLSALVETYLQNIANKNAEINAFIEVYAEEARAQAVLIDEKIKKGEAGKLAGLVIGIKDLLCYEGHEITGGSHILKGFKTLFTATAVERLLAEDVIIIGRQGCDEFGMGSSNEHSAYGAVKNPLDTSRVPGGSSGGSAAAVAAQFCHASLGTDTGGSVRQPAAFCGLVGLKPSYGRVSRWGLYAYASSFDQIGPITHNVEDAARILAVMAGQDEKDNTSLPLPSENYEAYLGKKTSPKKIAYIAESLESEGLDPEIAAAHFAWIEKLKAAGHSVEAVHFPYMEAMIACYYILTTAEASSNLSRYDGVRFGHRSQNAQTLEELYVKSRSEGFGEEVKRRIMLGTFVLSSGYYDAYYTQAQKVRRLIYDYTQSLLAQYDFLLSPVAPTTAFPLGEKSDDPIAMYLGDIYTVHANLSGNPAIAFPIAAHSNGMPIATQLMSKIQGEGDLLAFAEAWSS